MTPMPRHDDLWAEIAREEQRLAEMRAQAEASASRIEALRDRLADQGTAEAKEPPFRLPAPETNAQKVTLFRSLFRGREDVFARRWDYPRTDKSGYSPACANEWAAGICIKRKDMDGARGRASCGE